MMYMILDALKQYAPEVYEAMDLGGAAGCYCSERSAAGSKEQEYVDAANFVPKALLKTLAILRLVEGRD